MFCPVCHSEYRRGIETCSTCDVALVAELRAGPPVPFEEPAAAVSAGAHDSMVTFCGFLSLEDARQARDTLRGEEVRSEILIRDAATGASGAAPEEEYWLRVPASRFREVEDLLGEQPEQPGEDGDDAVACSDCGKPVAKDETTCPHCGVQFE